MLQRSFLLSLIVLSLNARAGNFSYVPVTTDATKQVQTLMDRGDYKSALTSWGSAFAGSNFAQTANGVATWAYLLYQNGVTYSALQVLMQGSTPEQIDPALLRLWKTEFNNSEIVQKGWIKTTGGWRSVVDNEPVRFPIKNKADIKKAFKRADSLVASDVNEKARIWWQIATLAPQIGEVDSALQAVKLLSESGQRVIGQDQIFMTQGRLLYQKGDIKASLAVYQQIPKSSSLWVEGVEERAWAHMRQDDYDKAMGDVTTALSPVLTPLAGPETYFLAHLLAYRVCDYTRLFDNSDAFKARHRARLNEIQTLSSTGTSPSLNALLGKFETNGVSQESSGPLVQFVPRQAFRDASFIRDMESRRILLGDAKKLTSLSSKSPEQAQFMIKMQTDAIKQADQFRQLAQQRLRTLATGDLKEYRVVLNKMNVIEAEVIQRLHLDDNLKGERSKLSKTDDHGDVLVFPYTKEVWMDELDNYQARVKDCPTLKGASL